VADRDGRIASDGQVVGRRAGGHLVVAGERLDAFRDGDPVDRRLAERNVVAGAELAGVLASVLDVPPVVGDPVGHDRPALRVGWDVGDEIVEHAHERVRRLVDDVSALAEHRRVVDVDAPGIGEGDALLRRLLAPGLCACRPGSVADLVDRFLRREEQCPDPEHGEDDDGADDEHSAGTAPTPGDGTVVIRMGVGDRHPASAGGVVVIVGALRGRHTADVTAGAGW
jgi:hypothetical protein